jgi:glyoxylase-like metal-dependent hydrolase (beta-lactamase superfamily II)
MTILPILSNSFDSNVFLIIDKKIALIDTGAGTGNLIDEIRKKSRIDLIINTHAHLDHCGGNKFFKCKVLVHESDAAEMRSGEFYGTCSMAGKKIPLKVDEVLKEGDKIDLGEHIFEVIHTPGHTPGSICLYERDKKILISGDTLFSDGSFGRADLGGNFEELINSLERLSKLDFNLLLPGHGNIAKNRECKNAIAEAMALAQGEPFYG